MNKKTIGPMTLNSSIDWGTSDYYADVFICKAGLRRWFNVPKTAEKLWIVLTKYCPSHGDATRVRCAEFSYYARLDKSAGRVEIYHNLHNAIMAFAPDCYATVYYEDPND